MEFEKTNCILDLFLQLELGTGSQQSMLPWEADAKKIV